MQIPATSRKRPAPVVQQQDMQQPTYQQFSQLPDNVDFSNFDFSNTVPADQTFTDQSTFDNSNLSYGPNNIPPTTSGNNLTSTASTELVRRARNQQLAPQNGQQEQWNGTGNMPASVEDEDEQALDARVALAKKDAQGKRKQIPQFVLKLSSFLDSNNTELIRWSDDGRSFIVLDEDQFARTLIPELFKHSNYASFVRQLNMYGFHKTVNITDGSLRQSEKARKGVKPPSMYSHPYFRKNRPDLLWLIHKPSNKSSGKRKRDGNLKDQYDSDDERQFSPVPDGRPQELSALGTSQDLAHLPRTELHAVRQELQKLQAQQRFISQMITELKEQNEQFYRQATTFQALHDRHENSINAILTFLATFYNRSMEGHGAQNLVNMFANATQNNQQHGSVVEEYNDSTPDANNQVQRYVKRQPLLLTGPVSNTQNQNLQPGSAVTQPSSARPSASPPNDGTRQGTGSSVPPESAYPRNAGTSASLAVENNTPTPTPTPNLSDQAPEGSEQMIDILNNVNATQASTPNTPALDFNSILDQYQKSTGNGPITPQQRDNMVSTLANLQGGRNSNNSALSTTQNPFDMDKLKQSEHALERLMSMQKQQDEKVQELNRRLQPLSPTGTIPGLHDTSNIDPFDSIGAPDDYDPNAFINFDESAWDGNTGDNGADFDFGFDAEANNNADWNFEGASGDTGNLFGGAANDDIGSTQQVMDGAGRVESVSSEATSPAMTMPDGDEPGTPKKKQRMQ